MRISDWSSDVCSSDLLPGAAQFVQVGLGGGNDPAIHGHALVRTQAFEGAFLQHPQQLDLQGQGHAFHFIEEQRAAVGVLDLADPPFASAGKSVGLVAENLAFEEVFRQAAAVERSEEHTSELQSLMRISYAVF